MTSRFPVIVCIPSRYHSRRLPGKALLNLGNGTVIQGVYRQAALSTFRTLVITDHPSIVRSIESIEGEVVYRRQKASNGSHRIFNYLSENKESLDPNTVIVNVQGDEPLVNPRNIKRLVESFTHTDTCIASLYGDPVPPEHYESAHRVKVQITNGLATTFERIVDQDVTPWYKHIGIYAFRWKTLKELMQLPPSEREVKLSLEQLRWMDNGYNIRMVEGLTNGFSIDTAADIIEARNFINS